MSESKKQMYNGDNDKYKQDLCPQCSLFIDQPGLKIGPIYYCNYNEFRAGHVPETIQILLKNNQPIHCKCKTQTNTTNYK